MIAGALALSVLVASQVLIFWAAWLAIKKTRFAALLPVFRPILIGMVALEVVTALFAVLPKKH